MTKIRLNMAIIDGFHLFLVVIYGLLGVSFTLFCTAASVVVFVRFCFFSESAMHRARSAWY